MKVIFEFDNHEDADDLKVFQSARKNSDAVYTITETIRHYHKHLEPGDNASDAEHRLALETLLKAISYSLDGLGIWASGADF